MLRIVPHCSPTTSTSSRPADFSQHCLSYIMDPTHSASGEGAPPCEAGTPPRVSRRQPACHGSTPTTSSPATAACRSSVKTCDVSNRMFNTHGMRRLRGAHFNPVPARVGTEVETAVTTHVNSVRATEFSPAPKFRSVPMVLDAVSSPAGDVHGADASLVGRVRAKAAMGPPRTPAEHDATAHEASPFPPYKSYVGQHVLPYDNKGHSRAFPLLPRGYILGHQSWTTPGVACATVVRDLRQALEQLKADHSWSPDSASMHCTMAAQHHWVRFTVRVFQFGLESAVVECVPVNGCSMAYVAAYRRLVKALPARTTAHNASSVGHVSHVAAAGAERESAKALPAGVPPCVFSPEDTAGAAASRRRLKPGDCSPLVRMAACGDSPLQRDAVAALAEVASCAANAQALADDGALVALTALISTSSDWSAVTSAISALANVLVALFSDNAGQQAAGAKCHAATEAACTAAWPAVAATLRKHDVKPAAADAAAYAVLRRECCRAMAAMAMNKRVAAAIVKAGGADALRRIAGAHACDATERRYASLATSRLQSTMAH